MIEWGVLAGGLILCVLLGFILSDVLTGAATADMLPPIPSTPGAPPASCSDGVQNQDETDVDCGGSCSAQDKKCAKEQGCSVNGDCSSDYCYIQWCRPKPTQLITPLVEKQPELAPEEPPATVIPIPSVQSPPRVGKTLRISIQRRDGKFVFVPDKLDIFTGDTLVFVNDDTVQHKPLLLDRSIEGGMLAPGQSWTIPLSSSGTYVFHDDQNPSTMGLWQDFKTTVTVKDWVGACDDQVKDLDETDIDCGGSCQPCALEKTCVVAKDCQSGLCKGTICSAPLPVSCFDEIKNQDETDVDCGGSCPKKCTDTKRCLSAADCLSGFCTENQFCIAPSCTDNTQSGDETDVDCGGSCVTCLQGNRCLQDSDCVTGFCSEQKCDIKTVTIQMVAKQFEFIPATVRVEKGSRVRINVTSVDVPHGFSLPDYNQLAELQPHVPQLVEFIADKTGTFVFSCHVYCGSGHGAMRGELIVEEKKEPIAMPTREEPVRAAAVAQPTKRSYAWLLATLVLVGGVVVYVLFKRPQAPLSPPPRDFVPEYVASMKKKGYSSEHIYRQLLHHGYAAEQLNNYIPLPKERLDQSVRRMRRMGYTKQRIMKELVAQGHTSLEIHDALERAKWS